jgi:drug/metabolite transporter (DMT)-like permease
MSRARGAELALVAVAAVWGLTFVMVQDAIASLPVLAFLAYRFLAAAALVALVAPRAVSRLGRDGVVAGAVMGVFLTGGYVTQTFALEHSTASNVGFITGLFVVLTPLLGAAVLRVPVTRTALLAAVVAASGLALLSGVGTDVRPLGDGLALACAVCFAAHILATGRGASAYDIVGLLVVQLTVCGGICLLAAGLVGDLEVPAGGQVWAALAVTTVLASAAGFFVQTYAQRHAPPARTALILASEPAFAGLFGFGFAGDRLTALGWVGAGLIVAAIVVVDLVPRLRPPRPLPEG